MGVCNRLNCIRLDFGPTVDEASLTNGLYGGCNTGGRPWAKSHPYPSGLRLPFGNTYLYVGGNPASRIDPTGAFSAFSPYVALGVAVCGYLSPYCAAGGLIYAGAAAGDYYYDSNCIDFGVRDQPQCTPA